MRSAFGDVIHPTIRRDALLGQGGGAAGLGLGNVINHVHVFGITVEHVVSSLNSIEDVLGVFCLAVVDLALSIVSGDV